MLIGWSNFFASQRTSSHIPLLSTVLSVCVPALLTHLISQEFWFLLSAGLAPALHSQDREIPHLPLGTGSSAQFCDDYLVAIHFHAAEIVAKSNEGRQETSAKENDFTYKMKEKKKKRGICLKKSNLKAIQKMLELQAIWCCFVPYSISVLAVQYVSLFFIYNYF